LKARQTYCKVRPADNNNVNAQESWCCLESGRGDAALNMAVDEALLEAMPTLHHPVLRFYGWNQAAASFGYFQKYQEVERLTALRPLVRRPTGGSIVPHDADWTYSVVFPTKHAWYGLSAKESYHSVHLWIQMAFEKLNLETELATIALEAHAGQCFVGHERSDLLWHGRKIAGAAQRRRKDGLLIQGSVQPPSFGINRMEWEQAMRDVATSAHAVAWEKRLENVSVENRARELALSKYSQSSYNQRR
jgi:hypothetical protein